MRENRHFVRSTDLANKSPTLIGGRPAVLSYRAAIDRIEPLAGRDAASLFAEPVLPHGADAPAATISWYSAYDGAAVELDEIDETARRPTAQKLTQRLEALAPALRDPEIGPTLASWLNLSSSRDILSVGGEPVLVNWGFTPSDIAGDAALREAHLARTLGRFAPGLMTMLAAAAGGVASAGGAKLGAADSVGAAAGGNGAGDPPPPPARPEQGRGGGRPWLAPLIATVVAALAFAALLIPGVLVYPERGASASNAFEEQRLRASNESLEAQLKALEDAGRERVCRADDAPIPVPLPPRVDGPPGEPGPARRMEIVPRAPDRVPAPRASDVNPSGAANIGELLDNATALVFGLKKPKDSKQGTGFFVSDRHIVTNHHVVQELDEDSIFVASRALGGIRHARLVAKSEPPPSDDDIRVDLAVLEIEPEPNRTALRLGVTPPKLSTTYVAGFPGFIVEHDLAFGNFIDKLATSLRESKTDEMLRQQKVAVPGADLKYGRINNVIVTGQNALPIVIHDMQLAPGNSGGPLIDACGRLGGVNTLLFKSREGPQQANVAQDVSLLRKFLSDHRIAFASDDTVCDPTAARTIDKGADPPPQAAPASPQQAGPGPQPPGAPPEAGK